MEYNFREIEKKWQSQWVKDKTYHVTEDAAKKKFYVLNMFPYPSGAGLHVGHPLGYIASDIYARYKRQNGYNVLNPMGYDAYGLPAEQYAIQTGQHPEVTTVANIARYRQQLDNIGFSFDWDREIRTCDPKYYHWTQWAFEKMFQSCFCNSCQKAQPIEKLVKHFEQKGTEGLDVAESEHLEFTADEWNAMSAEDKAAFTQTAMSNVHPHSYQPTAHTAVHQTDVEVHREVVYERETVKEPEHGHSGRTAEDGSHVRTATPATPASHEEPFVQETEDVHIVGQTKFQGHQAVILDLDGDAQPDVAVIDVNDNNQLDDQDVLIFRDGTTMTRGELAQSMSEDETGDVTPQTEHQPDHTEGYMQTAYEGAEPDGTTDGYDGMTDGYDGAQEDPYLHQASYSEDINTANDEGMMDPNLQQASYSEDPAMGYDDPNLGVDDAGTDMQYI